MKTRGSSLTRRPAVLTTEGRKKPHPDKKGDNNESDRHTKPRRLHARRGNCDYHNSHRAGRGYQAQRRVHSRRQRRLRRPRSLRRRRAARRADAAHRPARPRGSAPHAVSGRARLHTIARGADDRAILDPQRPVADHRSRKRQHAVEKRGHDGRVVQGRRLCDGDLRQVASRRRTAEPADSARLRRVLRHSARHLVGLVHLRRHDRADALDECAAQCAAGEGTANRRGRRGRSTAHSQAVHAGSPGRDRHTNWWRSRSTS